MSTRKPYVGSITMVPEGPDCISLLNDNELALGNGRCVTTIRGESTRHVAVLDRTSGATLCMTGAIDDPEALQYAYLCAAAPALLQAAAEALKAAEGQAIPTELAGALYRLQSAIAATTTPVRVLQ